MRYHIMSLNTFQHNTLFLFLPNSYMVIPGIELECPETQRVFNVSMTGNPLDALNIPLCQIYLYYINQQ